MELSTFHLEAGIASCYVRARSEDETDWRQILEFYDLLSHRDPSPIVALNRAVAVARVHGATAALCALDAIPRQKAVETYAPFHAVSGHLHFENGDRVKAAACFRRARELSTLETERALLNRRLVEAEKNDQAEDKRCREQAVRNAKSTGAEPPKTNHT